MSTQSHTTNPQLIDLFIKQNAQCCYCGCLCSVVHIRNKKSGRFRQNAATIEHLYSRYDIRRYAIGGLAVKMACYKCNHNRSLGEQRQVQKKVFDKQLNIIQLLKQNT